MKKRWMSVLFILLMVVQLTACGRTCKEKDCKEEIYDDGYCKYHYYMNVGDNLLQDIQGMFEQKE